MQEHSYNEVTWILHHFHTEIANSVPPEYMDLIKVRVRERQEEKNRKGEREAERERERERERALCAVQLAATDAGALVQRGHVDLAPLSHRNREQRSP
jgi:hypothetical protein